MEKTSKTLDRLYLTGTQSGVVDISNVVYDEPSGVATVTTSTVHGFSANDEITMSEIAFTCSGGSGITTTIFPDPQQSYTVSQVNSTTEFETNVGSANGITHNYDTGGKVAPLQMEFIGSFLENSTT